MCSADGRAPSQSSISMPARSVGFYPFGIDVVALLADGDADRLHALLVAIERSVAKRHHAIPGLCHALDEAGAFGLTRIAEFDAPEPVIGGGDIQRRMRRRHGNFLDRAGQLEFLRFSPGPAVMRSSTPGQY